MDANIILANRVSLSPLLTVKPIMSPGDRVIESILYYKSDGVLSRVAYLSLWLAKWHLENMAGICTTWA